MYWSSSVNRSSLKEVLLNCLTEWIIAKILCMSRAQFHKMCTFTKWWNIRATLNYNKNFCRFKWTNLIAKFTERLALRSVRSVGVFSRVKRFLAKFWTSFFKRIVATLFFLSASNYDYLIIFFKGIPLGNVAC